MIHKDPSHHLRRNAEEMRAALPFNILIDEPQIRLVHRGRPLQRVLSTLAMQVASRQGAATRRKRAAAVPPLLSVAIFPAEQQHSGRRCRKIRHKRDRLSIPEFTRPSQDRIHNTRSTDQNKVRFEFLWHFENCIARALSSFLLRLS
jgi:hypothetical protein